MRKGLLAAALAALLASHSLAAAQGYPASPLGHAWHPMGPPPAAPTVLRAWAPSGPVFRPTTAPNQAPPAATIPPGMIGWPPGGDAQNQSAAQAAPAAQADSPATATAAPPGLLNPAPADATAVPLAGESCPAAPDEDVAVQAPTAQHKHLFETKKAPPAIGLWASGEYLMWWFKPGRTPPLVSEGGSGVLGTPGVVPLIDNLDFANDIRSGGRFSLGYQFRGVPWLGVETSYFFIANHSNDLGFSSDGVPTLGRPFFNTVTGLPDVSLIAAPGVATGSVVVGTNSWLWGIETNVAAGIACTNTFHVCALAGLRYLNFADGLVVASSSDIGPNVPVFGGSTVAIRDSFQTKNDFYGGHLGAEAGVQFWKLTADVRAKVAIGDMHERAFVNGATVVTSPDGAVATLPGGLLALPTNIGRYSRDSLAFMPEVGVNVGLQVTKHTKLFVGYSFLWINNVARAGDQIDTAVNVTQLPTGSGTGALIGTHRPAFRFEGTDFWAQGLNFGLELRY